MSWLPAALIALLAAVAWDWGGYDPWAVLGLELGAAFLIVALAWRNWSATPEKREALGRRFEAWRRLPFWVRHPELASVVRLMSRRQLSEKKLEWGCGDPPPGLSGNGFGRARSGEGRILPRARREAERASRASSAFDVLGRALPRAAQPARSFRSLTRCRASPDGNGEPFGRESHGGALEPRSVRITPRPLALARRPRPLLRVASRRAHPRRIPPTGPGTPPSGRGFRFLRNRSVSERTAERFRTRERVNPGLRHLRKSEPLCRLPIDASVLESRLFRVAPRAGGKDLARAPLERRRSCGNRRARRRRHRSRSSPLALPIRDRVVSRGSVRVRCAHSRRRGRRALRGGGPCGLSPRSLSSSRPSLSGSGSSLSSAVSPASPTSGPGKPRESRYGATALPRFATSGSPARA